MTSLSARHTLSHVLWRPAPRTRRSQQQTWRAGTAGAQRRGRSTASNKPGEQGPQAPSAEDPAQPATRMSQPCDRVGGLPRTSQLRGTNLMTNDILEKIRRLSAKAQATPYEAEAMAFAAKAQALMTQYAIDAAMLGEEDISRVGRGDIDIGDPYASARFSLLSAVARSNRCRAIWSAEGRIASVFGTDHDRSNVDLLYTSLLVQATAVMTAEGSVVDALGRNRTRSFRQAFLVGYAAEVSRRLEAADQEVVDAAEPGVHPVLASMAHEVDGAVREEFPFLRSHRPSVSSGAGLSAGRDAGRRADVGTPRMPPSQRRSLTG